MAIKRPVLVNRGPAGLLRKVEKAAAGGGRGGGAAGSSPPSPLTPEAIEASRDRIAKPLLGLRVPLASLNLDPMNARLHPERNMEAIKLSLVRYGQMSTVTVRRQGMVVMKGNGTVEAARALGWTKIAAAVMDMDDATAAGYGLADNRTSDLAAWNFRVMAAIDEMLREAGESSIGWTEDELAAARLMIADERPPEDFPEVDEEIDVEHECPKCGYRFSGGKTVEVGGNGDGDQEEAE